jgi:hypothetical protein
MSSIQPGSGYTFTASSQGYNFSIQKSWSDWCAYPAPEIAKHPFQVTDLGPKVVGGNLKYWFTVQPGLVNNLDPMIASSAYFMTHMPVSDYEFVYYEWLFNVTTNYSYVVMKLGYDSTIPIYPDNNPAHVSASPSYPVVGSLSTMPVTGDIDSYIVLATAYKDPTTNEITVWQAVTKSLWTDRIKVAAAITARYYYASV